MVRILVADDSEMVRDGLISCLGVHPGFEIVGIASNGLEAIEKVGNLRPDVVIMDVQMPFMDGIEATRRIKESLVPVHVIMLSVFSDYMEASRLVGADEFLSKDCGPDELIAKVEEVLHA